MLAELDAAIDADSNENSFPNKSSLTLNAVIACLEDENQLIKRQMLDFLFTHLKLSNDYLSEQDKLVLVEAVTQLLIRKDLSVTRRVNQWLFGKPDLDNKYQITERNKYVIKYIVNGFTYVFKAVPTDLASATFPIKLFLNFYMEHDHMIELVLPELSFELLAYVHAYSQGSQQFAGEVLKSGRRLIESLAS